MIKRTVLVAFGAAATILMQSLPGLAAGMKLIPGGEAHARVSQLTSAISWNHSLGQAEATAQRQGKMIFWVQMLGDMAGDT